MRRTAISATSNDGYGDRMPETTLLAAAAGVVAGAARVGVVVVLRRLVVASKELGTDVEQATYQHPPPGVPRGEAPARRDRRGRRRPRAGRDLRALLGSEPLALVDRAGRSSSRATTRCARSPAGSRPRRARRKVAGAAAHPAGRARDRCRRGADPRRRAYGRRHRGVRRARAGRPRPRHRRGGGLGRRAGRARRARTPRALRSPKAEVRALRAQISPHFIYNSPSTRSPRSSTPTPRRPASSCSSSRTSPGTRSGRHGDFTTVAEELRSDPHATLRLEARPLRGSPDGDAGRSLPRCCRPSLPFLSIQPLVENAVRHGLGVEGGRWAHHDHRAGLRRVRPRSASQDDGVGIDPVVLETALAGRRSGRARGPAQRRRAPPAGLRGGARARRRDQRGRGHAGAHARAEVPARPRRGIRRRRPRPRWKTGS